MCLDVLKIRQVFTKKSRIMTKGIYALCLLLVAATILAFTNRANEPETPKKSSTKTSTSAENIAALKIWEASPDGIVFNNWKSSPQGKKVLAGAAKILPHTKDGSSMQAVVTSLTLPAGSRLGYGVMVSINGEAYILSFGALKLNEMQQLNSLKVNDQLLIKSHFVSYAPKYAYAIVAGNYVERNKKILYKRIPPKNGC
jgi:hypothetical protein